MCVQAFWIDKMERINDGCPGFSIKLFRRLATLHVERPFTCWVSTFVSEWKTGAEDGRHRLNAHLSTDAAVLPRT